MPVGDWYGLGMNTANRLDAHNTGNNSVFCRKQKKVTLFQCSQRSFGTFQMSMLEVFIKSFFWF